MLKGNSRDTEMESKKLPNRENKENKLKKYTRKEKSGDNAKWHPIMC